jgi:hypothetical protein
MSLNSAVRAGWNVATYQFFANALALSTIVALALSWGRKSEPFIIAFGLAGLFVLASRSEFFGFLSVAVGWSLLKAIQGRLFPIGVAVIASIALIAVGVTLDLVELPFIPPALTETQRWIMESYRYNRTGPRFGEVIDLGGSPSWIGRSKAFWSGIAGIQQSPFWGDYAGQFRDGANGAYIHNLLSAWRQYGIVAFLIYAGLCIALHCLSLHRSNFSNVGTRRFNYSCAQWLAAIVQFLLSQQRLFFGQCRHWHGACS